MSEGFDEWEEPTLPNGKPPESLSVESETPEVKVEKIAIEGFEGSVDQISDDKAKNIAQAAILATFGTVEEKVEWVEKNAAMFHQLMATDAVFNKAARSLLPYVWRKREERGEFLLIRNMEKVFRTSNDTKNIAGKLSRYVRRAAAKAIEDAEDHPTDDVQYFMLRAAIDDARLEQQRIEEENPSSPEVGWIEQQIVSFQKQLQIVEGRLPELPDTDFDEIK